MQTHVCDAVFFPHALSFISFSYNTQQKCLLSEIPLLLSYSEKQKKRKDDAQGTFCLFLGGKAAWQAYSGTLVSNCWLAYNIPDYKSFCPSSGRQANRIWKRISKISKNWTVLFMRYSSFSDHFIQYCISLLAQDRTWIPKISLHSIIKLQTHLLQAQNEAIGPDWCKPVQNILMTTAITQCTSALLSLLTVYWAKITLTYSSALNFS